LNYNDKTFEYEYEEGNSIVLWGIQKSVLVRQIS
jgi:hypothetical protein